MNAGSDERDGEAVSAGSVSAPEVRPGWTGAGAGTGSGDPAPGRPGFFGCDGMARPSPPSP